jgi:hypothetical protein
MAIAKKFEYSTTFEDRMEDETLVNPKQRHICVTLPRRYVENTLNGLAEECSEGMV